MSVLDRFGPRGRSREAAGELTCSELVELITEYLEEVLPPVDRARFDKHLGECLGCRIYLDQMRLTIQSAGRLSDESLPPQGREALLHAFRAWKQG